MNVIKQDCHNLYQSIKERPCNVCVKEGRPCGYFDNWNLVRRLYATRDEQIQELSEDEDECKQCKMNNVKLQRYGTMLIQFVSRG